jgi:hypothetical protein
MKRFWFYLSTCENAMGSTLLAHHTHTQFHSLLHTLAGLNEIRPLSVQFQHALHPIWLLRPTQRPNKDGRSKEGPRKKPLTGTQTAEATHISFILGGRKEISKVVMCPIPAWSPSSATLTLRAVLSTNSDSQFLGGCRWFETAVHPNSITWPHRRSMVTSERPFKASIVVHRPFTRRRHHIPVQSSRWWRLFLAFQIWSKSNFASLRNMSLRITLHEPSYA